jgi:hypothetical protein
MNRRRFPYDDPSSVRGFRDNLPRSERRRCDTSLIHAIQTTVENSRPTSVGMVRRITATRGVAFISSAGTMTAYRAKRYGSDPSSSIGRMRIRVTAATSRNIDQSVSNTLGCRSAARSFDCQAGSQRRRARHAGVTCSPVEIADLLYATNLEHPRSPEEAKT